MWYDWAYVHFEEVVANGDTVERFYPAKVLGSSNLRKELRQ
jgi:hypothetical protein